MSRDQFLRALRAYCRANSLEFRFDAARGKGGHGRVYIGSQFTTVKSGEIGKGLKTAMLKQLGLPTDSLG